MGQNREEVRIVLFTRSDTAELHWHYMESGSFKAQMLCQLPALFKVAY